MEICVNAFAIVAFFACSSPEWLLGTTRQSRETSSRGGIIETSELASLRC